MTSNEVVDFLNDKSIKEAHVEMELAGYPGVYRGTFRGVIKTPNNPTFDWEDGEAFWLTLDMGFELMTWIDEIQEIYRVKEIGE
jgi:hypothetical protein